MADLIPDDFNAAFVAQVREDSTSGLRSLVAGIPAPGVRKRWTPPRAPSDLASGASGRGATAIPHQIRPDIHAHHFSTSHARYREHAENRIAHLEDEVARQANIISRLADELTGAQLECGLLRAMTKWDAGTPYA